MFRALLCRTAGRAQERPRPSTATPSYRCCPDAACTCARGGEGYSFVSPTPTPTPSPSLSPVPVPGAAKENEPLVASSTNDKGPSAEAPTEKMPLVATNKYVVVTNTTIDAKLILGGVLFGAGWGLSGMCPGPGLINLATPVGFLPVLAFNAAMAAALALTPAATRLLGFA